MEDKAANKDKELEKKINDIFVRSMSAFILLPPVVLFLLKGGFLFFILVALIIVLSMKEWSDVCGKWSFGIDTMVLITFSCLSVTALLMQSPFIGLIFYIFGAFVVHRVSILRLKSSNTPVIPSFLNRPLFMLLGYLYITLGIAFFAYIRSSSEYGLETTLWLFACVVASDVMAYFTGRYFKGPKLMPKVSPNKTISGLLGGMVGGALVTYLFGSYLGNSNLALFIFGAFVAFVSQAGDLIQSGFKRYIGIKDMSNLIPGHGGILDRIDALLLAAILVGFVQLVAKSSVLMM